MQIIWEIKTNLMVLIIYQQMEQAMEIMKIHINNTYWIYLKNSKIRHFLFFYSFLYVIYKCGVMTSNDSSTKSLYRLLEG
jgi:hypothetical protein